MFSSLLRVAVGTVALILAAAGAATAFAIALTGAALMLTAGAVHVQAAEPTQQQLDPCAKPGWLPPRQRISVCTAAIASGQWKHEDLAWAFANRGAGYLFAGDLAHAVADTDEALRIDPGYALALNVRGAAYVTTRDYDRAIVDLDAAISLAPTNPSPFQNRGHALASKGQFDRAVADFTEAARLAPSDPAHPYSRGVVYMDQGRLDLARADFEQALHLNFDYVPALIGRGNARQLTGDLDGAIADFGEVVEREPANTEAVLLLDALERRNGQPSRLADTAVELDKTEWQASLVRLYLGQTTPDAVLAGITEADPRVKDDRVCEADFYIGELALVRGDTAAAVRAFRQAVPVCEPGIGFGTVVTAELRKLGVRD
jgi:lipoprotein NlpI